MQGNEKHFPKFDFKCLSAVAKETSCMCVCTCVSVNSLCIAAIRSHNERKDYSICSFCLSHTDAHENEDEKKIPTECPDSKDWF